MEGVACSVDQGKKSIDRRIFILAAVILVVSIGFGIVLPLLPLLAQDLGADPVQLGILTGAFALAQMVFAPFWGGLSDRIGRRRVLSIGIVGLGASFFATVVAPTYWWLLVVRTAGGILSSAAIPSAQAYAADLATPEQRSRVMGLIGAAFGSGFIFGPLLGALLSPWGVAAPFLAGGTLAVLTAVAVFRYLPETKGESQKDSGDGVAKGFGSRLVATWRVVNSSLSAYFAVMLFVSIGNAAVFSMLSIFLQSSLEATRQEVSYAFVVIGIASAVAQAGLASRLIDRMGSGRTVLGALLVGGVGFVGLALANGYNMALLWVTLGSAGMGLARPALTTAISNETEEQQGITFGVLTIFEGLGRVIGPPVAGLLYDITAPLPFWIGAVLFGLTFAAYSRWQSRRREAASA